MTKASDNAFPSILITEGTEPSAPAAGKQRIYIDSTTHLLKATNSSGTDRTIEGIAAGAITSSGLTQATARLLGRTTASTGAIEEITVGSGLTLAAGSLSASGGGGGTQGTELAYAEITSTASITATLEASADTIVSAGAVTYDGAPVLVQFFAPYALGTATTLVCLLFDGSTSLGYIIARSGGGTMSSMQPQLNGWVRFTPSAASHTYSIRAYQAGGSATIGAGAGGSGNARAAFIRITKV